MFFNILPQYIYTLQSVVSDYTITIITNAPSQKIQHFCNQITRDDEELDEYKLKKKVEKAGYALEYLSLTTFTPPTKLHAEGIRGESTVRGRLTKIPPVRVNPKTIRFDIAVEGELIKI